MRIPTQIVRRDSVDSTNSVLAGLLKDGAGAGLAVSAREQTRGRGQLGREWFSPPGVSLYISLSYECGDPQGMPFAVSLAVARTLRRACGVSAEVRWPNDVVAGGRKIAGILVEGSGLPDVWICGCGINVNVPEFPEDLAHLATSARLETGRDQDMDAVEQAFFEEVTRTLSGLQRNGLRPVLRQWRQADATPGSLIRIREGGSNRMVEAVRVDDEGGLVTKSGDVYRTIIGASTIQWVRTGPETEGE